jgi:hypothetical protein
MGLFNMTSLKSMLLNALGIGLCLLLPDRSYAGGLINNLPADGCYVVFKAKSEIDLQGNLQSFEREIKLASVGKESVENEPGRWLELSTEFAGRRVFAKLLIAEKYLKDDQNPFDHIAKAVARGTEGEVVELPKERLLQIMTIALPITYFEKLEKKERAKIRTELGEYDCDVLKGESERDGPMNSKIKVAGDIWTNDKVPFGLVKAKIKGELAFGTIETELELVKSGTDAKSEITN